MSIKLLVIGGVAGGATAAARARRLDEGAQIILFERGEFISFANCGLPYYISQVIENRDDLFVTNPVAFGDRYYVDVRTRHEVTAIDRKNKRVEVRNLATGETYTETYDRIILSPGAEPVKPAIPGIDQDRIFNLRNIPDSDRIKAYVDQEKPESAVVIGAGFIGLEMAEALRHRGVKTIILEKLPQVMPPLDPEMASIVQAHLKDKGLEYHLDNGATSFSQRDGRILVSTEKGYDIPCDMVILSVGVRPENHLAKEAGLELGERGGIRVDATMRTSDANIYAVGDAAEILDFITGLPTMTALAGPANRQARIAADNAMGRKSTYKGSLGTSVVKVLDLTVAATGAGERVLKAHHIPYRTSYTHSWSHASYYPGATTMSIKLIFSPSSGRILGAQIVGQDGVDKRIDVLATAIHSAMTVYDLEELELAYAPPYSSAKDPVNIAGYVASNILKDDLEPIYWNELGGYDPATTVLLDVRQSDELETAGAIDGARHIPLGELREWLADLDRNKDYLVFCAVGFRGYLAYRVLSQNGFKAKSLSGGYKTYLGAKEQIMKESPQTRLWLGE